MIEKLQLRGKVRRYRMIKMEIKRVLDNKDSGYPGPVKVESIIKHGKTMNDLTHNTVQPTQQRQCTTIHTVHTQSDSHAIMQM